MKQSSEQVEAQLVREMAATILHRLGSSGARRRGSGSRTNGSRSLTGCLPAGRAEGREESYLGMEGPGVAAPPERPTPIKRPRCLAKAHRCSLAYGLLPLHLRGEGVLHLKESARGFWSGDELMRHIRVFAGIQRQMAKQSTANHAKEKKSAEQCPVMRQAAPARFASVIGAGAGESTSGDKYLTSGDKPATTPKSDMQTGDARC
ncbi:hypothetical protein CYMTET_15866 [Cymbomonas tetramitiformis]|uniref:Uncharacterized protein n=1 Tax=Cymbomonas tetramitiformis TaxID=36881 RepID=A0AAE0GDI0_9CHLO|nr:hypothetical protein CYMTET_15866 [Cymbomonas tetramitiformis]